MSRKVVRIADNLVLRGEIIYARLRHEGKLRWVKAPLQGQSAPGVTGGWRVVGGVPVATRGLERWRDQLINDIAIGRWEQAREGLGQSSGAPSLDRLLEVYARLAADAYAERGSPRPATAADVAQRLRLVAGEMGVKGHDPVDRLTAEAVREWLRRRVTGAEDGARARYSAWRMLAQARSVWAAWSLEGYRRAGVEVPGCLLEWPRPGRGAAQAPVYRDPPDSLKRATVEGLDKLEQDDPELWVAGSLMLVGAMRPVDAVALRWSGIEQREGVPWLVYEPSKTQGRTGEARSVEVPLPADVVERWRRYGGRQYVLPGETVTARQVLINRRLNGWMRGIGWGVEEYPKASYELRKLGVSAALNAAGIEWAARLAGDNPETVRRYYAAMYRRQAPVLDARATILAATE